MRDRISDDANPYAMPKRGDLPPQLIEQGRMIARRLASSGASSGSILKRLRDIGIEGPIAESLAAESVLGRDRIRRLLGFATLLAGIAIIFIAWLLWQRLFAKLPIGIAMFGVFLCMLGCVSLFSRTHTKPSGPKTERLR